MAIMSLARPGCDVRVCTFIEINMFQQTVSAFCTSGRRTTNRNNLHNNSVSIGTWWRDRRTGRVGMVWLLHRFTGGCNRHQHHSKQQTRREPNNVHSQQCEDVALVEFMYLVLTRMPGESYRRRLRSLLLWLCEVPRALINSLVCWSFLCVFQSLLHLTYHRQRAT